MRRADGAQVTATVAPYSDMLHEYGSQHRWDEAVGVCRFVEDRGCWCALASMALEASNLDVAEISLAALREAARGTTPIANMGAKERADTLNHKRAPGKSPVSGGAEKKIPPARPTVFAVPVPATPTRRAATPT